MKVDSECTYHSIGLRVYIKTLFILLIQLSVQYWCVAAAIVIMSGIFVFRGRLDAVLASWK